MRFSQNHQCIDVHDLPGSLTGKHSTDVVLPNGTLVGLHGCREDAHQLLQECITQVSAVPVPLSPEAVLRLATRTFEQRLLQGVDAAA